MTQTQLDFDSFNPRAAARATDPVSSVMAAEAVAPHVTENELAALGAHYEQRHRESGVDDFELEALTGIKQTSIGVRRGTLEKVYKFVEKCGEPRPSTSGLTRRKVQGYRITRAGVEAYEKHLAEKNR